MSLTYDPKSIVITTIKDDGQLRIQYVREIDKNYNLIKVMSNSIAELLYEYDTGKGFGITSKIHTDSLKQIYKFMENARIEFWDSFIPVLSMEEYSTKWNGLSTFEKRKAEINYMMGEKPIVFLAKEHFPHIGSKTGRVK